MTESNYRGRFAPSPTGRLHFGSLVAALGSWLFARAAGGRWIVRMEDLDRDREVPGAADTILATLAAFGLVSDEPVEYQSRRREFYEAALKQLQGAGQAYRCRCSRADLEPFAGIHPARCVAPASRRHAVHGSRADSWRMRVGPATISFEDAIQGTLSQSLAGDVGDFVIWRADGGCAYQLAVVVDDALQGITAVVRGADLLDSTPRQILLQRALGHTEPTYAHLPLVVDAQGRKLSKYEAALPIDDSEPLPALRSAMAFLGQTPSAAASVGQFLAVAVRDFDIAGIRQTAHADEGNAAMRKASS